MEPFAQKEKFIELRAKGWSFDKIAKALKKSKPALINWNKELKEEVANRRALELEALYEEYYLLKESRIKVFGETLKKIKAELENRTFEDVPTDKLLDAFIKYYSLFKEEYVEPRFKTESEMAEEKQEDELLDRLTSLIQDANKDKLVNF